MSVARERSLWRGRGPTIASVAAHAALALALLQLAPSPSAPPPAARGLEVAIVRVPRRTPSAAATPARLPQTPAAAVARPGPLRATPTAAARPRRVDARPPEATPPPAVVASIAPPRAALAPPASATTPSSPEPAPGATRECPPGEGGFLVPIDPRSVAARALADEDADADAGVPAPGAVAAAPGSRRSGRQDDLETALRGSVRGPELSTRPPPPIRQAADGGYDVEGIRLRAHIAPDGRITFQDGPPIEDVGPTFIPGDRATGMSGSGGVGFRFDFNDGLWAAAGQDPLGAERNYLLRETQALRDRLSARARRVDEERGLLALSERLRVIAADRTLSPAARREAIFELWDDCATDAIGQRARTLVEDFVRERFPRGTALAYTTAELVRLNGRRVTATAFDLYGAQPGDGPKST